MAQGDAGGGARLDHRARPQQAALHRDRTRFKVIVAHRRFGKTVFAILQLLLGAMANRQVGTALCLCRAVLPAGQGGPLNIYRDREKKRYRRT